MIINIKSHAIDDQDGSPMPLNTLKKCRRIVQNNKDAYSIYLEQRGIQIWKESNKLSFVNAHIRVW